MRILFFNVLDPDGPAGADSYYPMWKDADDAYCHDHSPLLHLFVCGLCCVKTCEACNDQSNDFERAVDQQTSIEEYLDLQQQMKDMRLHLLHHGLIDVLENEDQGITYDPIKMIPILQFVSEILRHHLLFLPSSNAVDDDYQSMSPDEFHPFLQIQLQTCCSNQVMFNAQDRLRFVIIMCCFTLCLVHRLTSNRLLYAAAVVI